MKRTEFGNQETHLRNQTDKFWKSKVSFEKLNGQIQNQNDKNRDQKYFSF